MIEKKEGQKSRGTIPLTLLRAKKHTVRYFCKNKEILCHSFFRVQHLIVIFGQIYRRAIWKIGSNEECTEPISSVGARRARLKIIWNHGDVTRGCKKFRKGSKFFFFMKNNCAVGPLSIELSSGLHLYCIVNPHPGHKTDRSHLPTSKS